ncbi:MAG: c-type cytochrome [Hyphomicrobiales bacterium]
MTISIKTIGLSALFGVGLAVGMTGGAVAADAVAGEKIFKRCKACHVVGPDAKNKNGPQLNGIVGRTAGISDGFKYGTGIIEARGEVGDDADGDGYLDVPEGSSGLVWTEEALLEYLINPKAYLIKVTGNKKAKARMALRLKKEDQRANVIAYLKTFGLDGNPAAAE